MRCRKRFRTVLVLTAGEVDTHDGSDDGSGTDDDSVVVLPGSRSRVGLVGGECGEDDFDATIVPGSCPLIEACRRSAFFLRESDMLIECGKKREVKDVRTSPKSAPFIRSTCTSETIEGHRE